MKGEFGPEEEPIVQPTDLDQITAEYCERPNVVEVKVPLRDRVVTLTFNPMPRRKEYDAMVAHHVDQFNKLPKAKDAKRSHEYADFFPQSAGEYVEAAFISELSIEPKIALTTALKWLANPTMTKSIIEQIEQQSKTVAAIWQINAVESQKKSSNQDSESTDSE